MNLPEHAYAVILAGGGGTRLWPKSRRNHPKHLLKLFGDKTMLQQTFERVASFIPKEKIFVITHQLHADEAQKQLPDLKPDNMLVEPEAKNTALAVGTAAMVIQLLDPEAVIFNSHADHMITDLVGYQTSACEALEVAAKGNYLVAVGVKPTFAHTGLGYIQVGNKLDQFENAFVSGGFKEKPDLVTAQSFVDSGQYLWNTGYYAWSVKNLMTAFEKYSPEVFKSLEQLKVAWLTPQKEETVKTVYAAAENIAIDIAVSERADNIALVPGTFGWSDVGDWQVIYDMGEKDEQQNVVNIKKENFIGIDTHNTLIETNGRLIVTIGLEDIIVVDSPDATLICRKDRTQEVKKAVEKLKELKKEEYL